MSFFSFFRRYLRRKGNFCPNRLFFRLCAGPAFIILSGFVILPFSLPYPAFAAFSAASAPIAPNLPLPVTSLVSGVSNMVRVISALFHDISFASPVLSLLPTETVHGLSPRPDPHPARPGPRLLSTGDLSDEFPLRLSSPSTLISSPIFARGLVFF